MASVWHPGTWSQRCTPIYNRLKFQPIFTSNRYLYYSLSVLIFRNYVFQRSEKSLRKSQSRVVVRVLTEWIRPCENHLYWSATTTMCGTGRIIWAKFKSFLSHIINKHDNLDDPLFNRCGHGSNIQHRKLFLPSMTYFYAVC